MAAHNPHCKHWCHDVPYVPMRAWTALRNKGLNTTVMMLCTVDTQASYLAFFSVLLNVTSF